MHTTLISGVPFFYGTWVKTDEESLKDLKVVMSENVNGTVCVCEF